MPSVEMGQGIYTAEAVLLAEELDVGLDQVDLVAAPPDTLLYAQPLFKAQMTGGSTSIRGFWTPLRQAGATARAMLVAAAATRWSVPPETCSTDRATVRHEASGRSLSYGELAGDAAAGPTPANVPLKGAGQWKLIGQSVKRLDTPQKVNGQAVFGIDVAVPGMKIAAVMMCPVDGGRIASLDDTRFSPTSRSPMRMLRASSSPMARALADMRCLSRTASCTMFTTSLASSRSKSSFRRLS